MNGPLSAGGNVAAAPEGEGSGVAGPAALRSVGVERGAVPGEGLAGGGGAAMVTATRAGAGTAGAAAAGVIGVAGGRVT